MFPYFTSSRISLPIIFPKVVLTLVLSSSSSSSRSVRNSQLPIMAPLNLPSQSVLNSFLLMARMPTERKRVVQLMREKGTLKGQKASIPHQNIVPKMKARFPNKVYTPPRPVLQFSSYFLRKDRNTPGTITSSTGIQEHFLQRELMRSGMVRKIGEANSVAQSLQDLSRVQCIIAAASEKHPVEIKRLKVPCFMLLNLNSLIAPTQMQTARMSLQIQFSTKTPIRNIAAAKIPLARSHLLILQPLTLKTVARMGRDRKRISSQHTNEKNKAKTKPKYVIMIFAFLNCSLAQKQMPAEIANAARMKMRNRFHLSSIARGQRLQRIDQILECKATPTMIKELRREITIYPNQNFLCLSPLSQSMRKENGYSSTLPSSVLTLSVTTMRLKQFYFPMSSRNEQLFFSTISLVYKFISLSSGKGLLLGNACNPTSI